MSKLCVQTYVPRKHSKLIFGIKLNPCRANCMRDVDSALALFAMRWCHLVTLGLRGREMCAYDPWSIRSEWVFPRCTASGGTGFAFKRRGRMREMASHFYKVHEDMSKIGFKSKFCFSTKNRVLWKFVGTTMREIKGKGVAGTRCSVCLGEKTILCPICDGLGQVGL